MRCPFATWKPIAANITHGGRGQIRGFVPHVQVGYGSLFGFFNTPKPAGRGASADFWCSKQGTLEEYVDLVDQSWAQGSKQHNGNPHYVSCEFEGHPDERMTPAQIDMGGRLIAWAWANTDAFPLEVNHDPEGVGGITPHYVFGGGHTCPGPGPREGQFPDLITAANRYLTGDDMPVTDKQFNDLASQVADIHRLLIDVKVAKDPTDKECDTAYGVAFTLDYLRDVKKQLATIESKISTGGAAGGNSVETVKQALREGTG